MGCLPLGDSLFLIMSYTYAQLKTRVNAKIKGKIGILVNSRDTLNEGARQVMTDIDLRSARRKTQLTPNLSSGRNRYTCPSDLKGYGIIDIKPQVSAQKKAEYDLIPVEEFGRTSDNNVIAIEDADNQRNILVKTETTDKKVTISTFDDTTAGGGTWSGFGDGTNVSADSDNYVSESGSLKWDISAAAGTTAGVVNSTLNQIDFTDYLNGNGFIRVYVYIVSTTNITNFIIRVGNDSSNYYSKTVTAQADGTAFQTGWNELRFDLTSLTETGSVTDTTIDYIAIYMTKSTAKVSETGYRFDSMILARGEIHYVHYYSKYPWRNSSGTYLANSTADSDILNADEDEFNLIVKKCSELAADEVDEDTSSTKNERKYTEEVKAYKMNNPSEAKTMTSRVANFI